MASTSLYMGSDRKHSLVFKALGSYIVNRNCEYGKTNSNFLQMFSRYGRKCKQIAFWVLSAPILHVIPLATRVSVYAECIYVSFKIKILSSSLNTKLIVDKHCSDVCCDEFLVSQTDRKSKQIKEQWHKKVYLQSVWGKLVNLNTKNIKICEWIKKSEATEMQFVCILFHIC